MPQSRLLDSQVLAYSERYQYGGDDELAAMAEDVRARGLLLRHELVRVADWKSPRIRPRILAASEDLVEEATAVALFARSEELRIGALTVIPGVGYPLASVVLHFFHPDPYPIIDVRALWSLGFAQPSQYTFRFWLTYVLACRSKAEHCGVPMRVLDRALWQYSKENQ